MQFSWYIKRKQDISREEVGGKVQGYIISIACEITNSPSHHAPIVDLLLYEGAEILVNGDMVYGSSRGNGVVVAYQVNTKLTYAHHLKKK